LLLLSWYGEHHIKPSGCLLLVARGSLEKSADDANKLVRMVRRADAGSARDLLPIGKLVREASGVDDRELRTYCSGQFGHRESTCHISINDQGVDVLVGSQQN
jgi:hypothetical protein